MTERTPRNVTEVLPPELGVVPNFAEHSKLSRASAWIGALVYDGTLAAIERIKARISDDKS